MTIYNKIIVNNNKDPGILYLCLIKEIELLVDANTAA